MRVVALALILAVGPIGPTLCTVRCAETSAVHAMAGMSAGAHHQTDDMSAHDMTNMSTVRQDPSDAPCYRSTLPADVGCSHSGRVEPTILRAADAASSPISAAAVFPTALRVDLRAMVPLEAFAPPLTSSSSHRPLSLSLRI